MRTAIYPGTFDPVTNGHLDLLERACRMFDEVVIAVAINAGKGPLFSVEERLALLRPNLKPEWNVRAESFDGLLVDFARKHKAIALVRGLRAVSDFEYEFQMAMMNRHLDGELETVFLMPREEYFYTSSRLIKGVAYYDDRVGYFVPKNVATALAAKFRPQA